MAKRFFFILLFSLFGLLVFSQNQNSDTQLAYQYFRNNDFEKATVLYKKLFEQNKSSVYYRYYVNCLIGLQDYELAEKVIKKQLKKKRNKLPYYIELGSLYKLQNKPSKAKDRYDYVIKKLPVNENQISIIANKFIVKREYDYAEKVFLKGQKLLNDKDFFNFELANLYYYQRNYSKMIEQYLDMLSISEMYLQTVQNRLQSAVYGDVDNSLRALLKAALIKRIQKQADKTVFNELLIWLYIQDKDFENAMVQAKALDLRKNENGERLIALARLSNSNENYDVAVSAYQYVIDKGVNFGYYLIARKEQVEVLYKKLITENNFQYNDLLSLENNFINTIFILGENDKSVELSTKLAHLQAFYIDEFEKAIKTLNNSLKIKRADSRLLAKCKLELADVYLYSGDMWNATLTYAQVERSNKNNPIGYEAKFRKSKLAYYIGDFKWAQAQLDVLKASTSKLIANDACQLSLIISDNSDDDSVNTSLEMYARADLLVFRNKDSLALLTLDSIFIQFPTSSIIDDAIYKKATIYINNKQYIKAAENFKKIVNTYSYDVWADNSLFNLAKIYDNYLNDKEKAQKLYKRILTDYPGSIYVVQARKRFRLLRGDLLE
ncbi:MAG: tetratricopeptide repeat protein [Bacteroidales bacterium]|nr:tetratricopeptide repeat protein [Bacteroidales bacterium]